MGSPRTSSGLVTLKASENCSPALTWLLPCQANRTEPPAAAAGSAGAGAGAGAGAKGRGKGSNGQAGAQRAKLSQNTDLMRKLRKAYTIASGEEDAASLSKIGQALRRLDPGFDPRSYGHTSLSSLVNALKDQL
ncbi:MAG TPA: OST-HTH/LOTUS domain-containing protein, partial [Burkholderiaceae bacterium]|nr:OST-HTH/LOTUS domain-containing protein [Burkholderiaceae bacterium]